MDLDKKPYKVLKKFCLLQHPFLIFFPFLLIFIFFLKIIPIFSGVIDPGLNILGLVVKSIMVDSNPISLLPPSKINLILFLNSSTTSFDEVGLSLEDILALGAASGTFNKFSNFLVTLCLGNLTAIVFFLAVAICDISDFEFFFSIKVIGPGQKAL